MPLREVAVSGAEPGPTGDSVPNTKALKDKWTGIFFETLKDIFALARQYGIRITPDQALEELDDALEDVASRIVLLDQPHPESAPHRPLRVDVVAIRTKLHHKAVDLYYQTYFPRKAGMEAKPRRGASTLSFDYLYEVLTLSRKGMNPAQIATKMGQLDPKAKGRIAKQIRIAEKRYGEILSKIQAQIRRQQSRNPEQS
jgi:hypothetical protein